MLPELFCVSKWGPSNSNFFSEFSELIYLEIDILLITAGHEINLQWIVYIEYSILVHRIGVSAEAMRNMVSCGYDRVSRDDKTHIKPLSLWQ